MATDAIDDALAQLEAGMRRLALIHSRLALLHDIAYTASTGGEREGGIITKMAYYNDDIGDPKARKIWNDTRRWIDGPLSRLIPIEHEMEIFLAEGELAEDGPLTITQADHAEALRYQAKRGGRAAFVKQPNHPKG